MKLRDLLKENEDYQLVLAQSANLEIPEDFEQLDTREYKDMLNKLHDLYGEGKYTKEPAHFLSTAIDYILDDPREDDLKTAHEFLHKHKNAAAKELSDKTNPIYPGYTSTVTENKTSPLRNIIRKEIKKSLNEGIFDSSPDREKRKLEDALDRFVKYSIENGDSEDEVLSTLERKGRDAIDIYLGGKIDDDKLFNMYDDIMSNVSDQVMKRGK